MGSIVLQEHLRPIIVCLLLFSLMNCSRSARIASDCRSGLQPQTFLDLANRLRAGQDSEPLEYDPELSRLADQIAEFNLEGRISHLDANGSGPLDRIRKAGLKRRMVAENIALVPGGLSAERVLESWRGKKEEESLIDPLYHRAGYAVVGNRAGCVVVLILTE